MGQRPVALLAPFFSLFCAILVCAGGGVGCDTGPSTSTAAPTSAPATRSPYVTVASLVPAATDLVLGMKAGEHLVAVSNWDADRPEIRHLPRVGDYRSIDWEKLTQLRPGVMIVQFRADKMPPGLGERAQELGIKLVNVRNNRLEHLYETLDLIGDALGERGKSDATKSQVKASLETIQRQVAGKPPVRTLLLRSAQD